MKIIDLTHPIGIGTPGYTGCARIVGWPLMEIALKDYNMLHISTDLHTGTHLDAALHCVPDGRDTSRIPLEDCIGAAFVLDLTHKGEKGAHFEVEDFEPHADAIRQSQKLLVQTGWSKHWGTPEFFDDFPGFRRDAAQYLVDLGLRLIGVEQASIHPSDHLEVHRIFFREDVVIVESLADLVSLPQSTVEFFAAPWRFEGGDGSLVRAFARVEEGDLCAD